MRNPPDPDRLLNHSDATELLAHPDRFVSYVKALLADGDFRGAVALLREALHQDPGNSDIRGLLAQTQLDLRICDEKRAWLSLMSETRELVEDHVERGEFSEAEAILTGVESRHGPVEELWDLANRLQVLRREREQAEVMSHLIEAQRLRDEGYLQESVWEARQALALDPRNRAATSLADALILEIEEQELEVAVRRDATRIGALLGRGRLLRAGLLIRNSRRKYGNLPALQAQLQRRRRLRMTRWARRWVHVSQIAGAPARWVRGRGEEWGKARRRLLIARLRQQKKARVALMSEARARVEGLVERGRLSEAQTVLARAERRNCAIEDLQDLKDQLEALRRERERAEVSGATQRDATRTDTLLEGGRLLRAELRIKRSQRKYGDLPVFRDQLQRCRRLQATRWAERRTLTSHAASAPARWIRQQVEERRSARMGILIARLREQQRVRVTLVSETRTRIGELVEQGEHTAALAALVQVESRHGAIEDLEDWRDYLQGLRLERESTEVSLHLSEALRLRDEDCLQESVREARQVLDLDPQNTEARTLMESLILEIEVRELKTAARRDVARISELLRRGRLLPAEVLIRRSRQQYGDRSALQEQFQRCRRLWKTRWARRWQKIETLASAVSVDRLRPRIDNWSMPNSRVLVAVVSLVVLATAGIYVLSTLGQRESDTRPERTAGLNPSPAALTAPSGDLILDALPWGRIVAIVGQGGEQQDLGDSLFTPVRHSLPAGSYRVVLENPAVEKHAEFWVQVFPSGVTTKVHEFKAFDADSYFGKAWW